MTTKSISRGWQGKQVSSFGNFRNYRKGGIQTPSIVTNNLQFYYNFGNGNCFPNTNTTVTDLSGQANNGTLTNGPTYSSTHNGIINFDGINDYILGPIKNIGSAGTLSVWFYKTGNGSPDLGNVVDLVANVALSGRFGWSLGINVNTNKLDFYIANNGSFGVENFSTEVIANNRWYNATATYDGSNKIIYINGKQDSSFASTVNGTNTADAWGFASRTSSPRYFQGSIGQATIYDRALTSSEIWANFQATRTIYGA